MTWAQKLLLTLTLTITGATSVGRSQTTRATDNAEQSEVRKVAIDLVEHLTDNRSAWDHFGGNGEEFNVVKLWVRAFQAAEALRTAEKKKFGEFDKLSALCTREALIDDLRKADVTVDENKATVGDILLTKGETWRVQKLTYGAAVFHLIELQLVTKAFEAVEPDVEHGKLTSIAEVNQAIEREMQAMIEPTTKSATAPATRP